jgi:hypothetical protein
VPVNIVMDSAPPFPPGPPPRPPGLPPPFPSPPAAPEEADVLSTPVQGEAATSSDVPSTAPFGENAGDNVGMPDGGVDVGALGCENMDYDGHCNSIVPEAKDVPVAVVTPEPDAKLAAPEANLAPNPGGCKATNPTLTPAARDEWALWCDNTCNPPIGSPSNCVTPEMTGAAACVCV